MKRTHGETGHAAGDEDFSKRAKHETPTLYWNPDSSHSKIVHLFAAAIGANLEHKVINLATGENKSADFLKINPAGQVPTLVDGDLTISESSSIMRYLAHKHPSKLYPLDNLHLLGRIDYANEYIRQKAWDANSSLVYQSKWAPMFSGKPTPPEVLAAAREKFAAALNRLCDVWFHEHADHVVGIETSMADVTLIVMLHNVVEHAGYDLSAHPKLKHFYETAQSNPLLKI